MTDAELENMRTRGTPLERKAAHEIERLRTWNYQLMQRADAAQTEVERLRGVIENTTGSRP